MNLRNLLFNFICLLTCLPNLFASSWRIPATELKFKLPENSPVGHILGNAAGPALQNGITNAFGAPSQLFHLNSVTSELSVKAEIDAEKLCALAMRREDEQG